MVDLVLLGPWYDQDVTETDPETGKPMTRRVQRREPWFADYLKSEGDQWGDDAGYDPSVPPAQHVPAAVASERIPTALAMWRVRVKDPEVAARIRAEAVDVVYDSELRKTLTVGKPEKDARRVQIEAAATAVAEAPAYATTVLAKTYRADQITAWKGIVQALPKLEPKAVEKPGQVATK